MSIEAKVTDKHRELMQKLYPEPGTARLNFVRRQESDVYDYRNTPEGTALLFSATRDRWAPRVHTVPSHTLDQYRDLHNKREFTQIVASLLTIPTVITVTLAMAGGEPFWILTALVTTLALVGAFVIQRRFGDTMTGLRFSVTDSLMAQWTIAVTDTAGKAISRFDRDLARQLVGALDAAAPLLRRHATLSACLNILSSPLDGYTRTNYATEMRAQLRDLDSELAKLVAYALVCWEETAQPVHLRSSLASLNTAFDSHTAALDDLRHILAT